MSAARTSTFERIRNPLVSTESIGNHESLTSNNISKHEFGNFQDTGDWIECESTSYPGNTYFFNLRTRCSTWIRPVGRNVTLQRFRKHPRVYDKNFTRELDNATMIVSSESEEDYHSSQNKRSRSPSITNSPRFRRAREKIFALLYCNADIGDCLNDSDNNNVDDFVPDTLKDLRHEQDRSPEYYEVSGHFLTNDNDHDKIRISKDCLRPSSPAKMVCEMNGVKTISFEPGEMELPPGVKRTNLSDSSVTSSSTGGTLRPSVPNKFEFANLGTGVQNLSSDSSSSCSCSTCTSSGTSGSSSTSSGSKREE